MKTLEKMNKKERKSTLLSVAEEVQKICNFDKDDEPPKKGNEKELTAWLTEAYQEIAADDNLSDEAVAVFAELGISPAPKKEKEDKTENKADKKVKSEKALTDKKDGTNNYVKATDRTIVPKKELVSFFNPLIKVGKHDQRALLEKGMSEFGKLAKKSVTDFLSYSKNPKYLKFDKLVVVDKKGNLKFEK